MEESIQAGVPILGVGVPILEPPVLSPEDEALQFFKGLVQQDENFYEAVAPFQGSVEVRDEVLNEIASTCLHFTIARLFRYTEQSGSPSSIRFKIEVEVMGDDAKIKNDLIS